MAGIFALFKGDSGAGKTVGALSFPNPVVLDHDRKMPAIAEKHFPGKDIPYKQFTDVLQVGDLLETWLNQGCPFDTVIGDSLTTLSYSCLKTIDDLKGTNIMTKLRDLQQQGAKKVGSKPIELRGFDYYNAEDNFLKYYIDSLKMLWQRPGRPHHVILTAHIMTSESENIKTKEITKMRRIVTAGQKIAAYIPAQFDECWHFATDHGDILSDTGRVKHFMVTEAIGEDYAKTAYNLPAKVDFTNGSLFQKIANSIDGQSQAQAQAQAPQIEAPAKSANTGKLTL